MKKIFVIFVLFFNNFLFSNSGSWNIDSDGNWNDGAKWTDPSFPDGTDQIATFGNAISVPRTVTLNQGITLGGIYFDSTVSYDINFTIGNSFLFSSSGLTVSIYNNSTANHIIRPNIQLLDNLILDCALNAGDIEFTNQLAPLSITKNGSNKITFSGVPTVSIGTLTINNGTVLINKTGGGIVQGAMSILGGVLELGGANQISGTATLFGGELKMNGFPLSLFDFSFYSGTLNQGGGLLTITNLLFTIDGGNTVSGPISMTGATTLQYLLPGGVFTPAIFTSTSSLDLGGVVHAFNITEAVNINIGVEIEGVISNGGILKTGPCILKFLGSNANTYTGLTTVQQGKLLLGKDPNVIAVAGNIEINGGTLDVQAINQIANTSLVTIDAGSFLMNSNAQTISSLTYNGGTLNQGGATLSLASTLTALTMRNTTISDPITLSSAIAIGDNIVFDNTNNGTATISGPLSLYTGVGSITRTFNITDGAALVDMDIQGVLSQTSGSAAVTKLGNGTLQFSGGSANTYSGNTSVTTGTLLLNKTISVNAIAGNVLINGGTLKLAQPFQIANTSDVTLSSGTFDLNAQGENINSLTFNGGTLSQGGADLTLSNTSVVTPALTMRNTTISGPITISGATGGIILFDTTNGGTATISSVLNLGAQSRKFNIPLGGAATDMNISGTISNGSVEKDNTGILEFSGALANTFSDVTVNAGTLKFNKSAGVNALSGNINISGGTLLLGAANQIPNTSSLTINSGAFNMSGNNESISNLNFYGGTLSQGGATLSLASNATALTMRNTTISGLINITGAALGGNIVFDNTNNGTATIAGNIDLGANTRNFNIATSTAAVGMLVSGVISNGGITKIGGGNLQLTNVNSYALGTAINNGKLIISSDNNLGSGALSFDGGTLTPDADVTTAKSITVNVGGGTLDTTSANLTITGAMSGSGALTKEGGGILTLSVVDKIYSGILTSNAGSMIIDCNLSSAHIELNNTILKGNFTVSSITANAGSHLRPGSSIGTVHVTNMIFNSGSTYQVEIDPITSDLVASNTVTINPGATLEVVPLTTALNPGFRYEIISSGAAVSGTFSNIVFDNPSITGTIFYNLSGFNVILELFKGEFINSVSTGNPGIVARYLDTLNPPDGSDLDNIFNLLVILPPDEMAKALDQLHPAPYKGLSLTQLANASNISGIIQNRSAQFYQNACIRDECCKKRASVWVDPLYSYTSQQDYNNLVGFDSNSVGFVLGSDYMVCKNLYFGVAASYSYSDIDMHNARGGCDVNNFYGNIYSTYFYKRFFINASLLGAYNHYKCHRNIDFLTIHRKATNDHSGAEFLAYMNTGFIVKLIKTLEFRPFVSGEYVYLKEDAFKEKGANSLDLEVRKTKYDSYRVEAGGNFGSCFNFCRYKLMPDLKLSYIREERLNGKFYTSNLVDQPGSFTVEGMHPNRNIFSYGFTMTALMLKDKGTISLRYNAETAKNYSNYNVDLEFGVKF